MAIEKFEDIIGWQKAQDYAVDIYAAFSNLRDFSFKDQICRAVVSIFWKREMKSRESSEALSSQ